MRLQPVKFTIACHSRVFSRRQFLIWPRILIIIVARPPSAKTGQTGIVQCKGLAKLGNIVAQTSLQTQMFPSLAARETSVAD